MNQEKPKVYTAEFRESSVKLAIESDRSVAQTARDIGVNENTLHTWINKYRRPVDDIKAVRTDAYRYEELKRLKKEVVQLTEERDLLKRRGVLCQGATVKYTWIKQHRDEFTVLSMCRFYRFHRAPTMAGWIKFLHSGNEKMGNSAVL